MPDIANFSISDLQSDNQRNLFAWYSAIADKNRLPSRTDFEPLNFPRALPYLLLLDVEESPRRFRVRLVGTQIVNARGIDDTGRYLDQDVGGEAAIERAGEVVANWQPIFASDLPMDWSPMNYKKYSVLILPLSSDGKSVDMLISCSDFK